MTNKLRTVTNFLTNSGCTASRYVVLELKHDSTINCTPSSSFNTTIRVRDGCYRPIMLYTQSLTQRSAQLLSTFTLAVS